MFSWDSIHHVEFSFVKTKLHKNRLTKNHKIRLNKTDHFKVGRKPLRKSSIFVKSNAFLGDPSILQVLVRYK